MTHITLELIIINNNANLIIIKLINSNKWDQNNEKFLAIAANFLYLFYFFNNTHYCLFNLIINQQLKKDNVKKK